MGSSSKTIMKKLILIIFTIILMFLMLLLVSCSCNNTNEIESTEITNSSATEDTRIPLAEIYNPDDFGKISATDENGQEITPTDYYEQEISSITADGYPVYPDGSVSSSIYGEKKEKIKETSKKETTQPTTEEPVSTLEPTLETGENEVDINDLI